MRRVAGKTVGMLYALAIARTVTAQDITRDNYVDSLPPRPARRRPFVSSATFETPRIGTPTRSTGSTTRARAG